MCKTRFCIFEILNFMPVKKVILFFALGLISFATYSQQNSTSAADISSVKPELPEALKMKEVEFDFGKIPQGKPVHHSFEVLNAGIVPLNISNVVASCGCTTPEWEKDSPVAPGATSQINIGYNAAAEGVFHKSITITYNNNQTKVIQIKGEVWKAPATSAPENKGLSDLKN